MDQDEVLRFCSRDHKATEHTPFETTISHANLKHFRLSFQNKYLYQ